MEKKNIVRWMAVAIVVLVIVVLGRQIAVERNSKRVMKEYLEAKVLRLEEKNKEFLVQLPEEGNGSAATVASAAPSSEVPAEEQPPVEAGEPEPVGRRLMRSQVKMKDIPSWSKAQEAAERASLGVRYSDLIDYLKLDAEETKHLIDLLICRGKVGNELGSKMLIGDGFEGGEENMALVEELKQAEEEIRSFLNNPDDAAEWEFYEKTEGERRILSDMDQKLGPDAELSDEAYRELVSMMSEERSNFDYSDLGETFLERYSKKYIDVQVNEVRKLDEQIIARAEGMLTPEQFDAFMKTMAVNMEMRIALVEMGGKMYGDGK